MELEVSIACDVDVRHNPSKVAFEFARMALAREEATALHLHTSDEVLREEGTGASHVLTIRGGEMIVVEFLTKMRELGVVGFSCWSDEDDIRAAGLAAQVGALYVVDIAGGPKSQEGAR